MIDAIEFEVTEPAKINGFILWSAPKQDSVGNGHITIPAEFDVVARKMGYSSHQWIREIQDTLSKQANLISEDFRDTLRRIIGERDDYQKKLEPLHLELLSEGDTDHERPIDTLRRILDEYRSSTRHQCTIDGVTYRGNEETIFALKRQHEMAEARGNLLTKDREIIADLKCQLAESNTASKWMRKKRQAGEDADDTILRIESDLALKDALIRNQDQNAKHLAEHLGVDDSRAIYDAVCAKHDELKRQLTEVKAKLKHTEEVLNIAVDDCNALIKDRAAQSSPSIPAKWQTVIGDIAALGIEDSDPAGAALNAAQVTTRLLSGSLVNAKSAAKWAVARFLNWLAAELEKGGGRSEPSQLSPT